MNTELVSIRMLCVAATHADQNLWREGAAVASVPVDFDVVVDAAAAAQLARGGIDVCVVDSRLPDAERAQIIAAARAAQPAPFIIVSAPRGTGRIDGVDGMVARPSNPEAARGLVDLCARVKIPTRVLIVDNSGTVRGIVRKMLAASRFALDLDEANDADTALDRLRNGNFGIVFVDDDLPGLSGIQALAELRRTSPNVAVVMMTSAGDKSVAVRMRKAGALACLNKPFYPADLDAVLERYFGLHKTLA